MNEDLLRINEILQNIYGELIRADRSFPLDAENHLIDERIAEMRENFKEAMEQLDALHSRSNEPLDVMTKINIQRTGGALTLGIVRNLNHENVNACGELLYKYISDIYFDYIYVDVVNGIICEFIEHSIEHRKEGLAGEVVGFVINEMAQSYGVSTFDIISDITDCFLHSDQGNQLSFSTLFLNIIRQNPNLAHAVIGNLTNRIEQYTNDLIKYNEFLEPSVSTPSAQTDIDAVQQDQNDADIKQQVQQLKISRNNEQRPRVVFNEGLPIDAGDNAEEHENLRRRHKHLFEKKQIEKSEALKAKAGVKSGERHQSLFEKGKERVKNEDNGIVHFGI